ncbi:unnamed protein product, partial [Effrenium voratum]
RLDVCTVSSLIVARGHVSDVSGALAWISWMRRNAVEPDEQAFASGLAVCSAGKEWWSALGLLQDMAQQQLQLGSFSLTAGISACESRRRWRWALRLLFSEASEASEARLPLAANAALAACEKGWAWRHALALWLRRAENAVDAVGCNSVCAALAGAELWRSALQALRLRRLETDVVRYTTVLGSCPSSCWPTSLELAAVPRQGIAPNPLLRAALQGVLSAHGWRRSWQLLADGGSGDESLVAATEALCARVGPWVAARLEKPLRAELKTPQEDYGQAIAACEALAWWGRLACEDRAAFGRRVYAPAVGRLRLCAAGGAGLGGGFFLVDGELEKRFSLGVLCSSALRELELGEVGAWRLAAQKAARRRQGVVEGGLEMEPSAQAVLAWSACWLTTGAFRVGKVWGVWRSQPSGVEAPRGAGHWGRLRPVFADHDRSGHAERRALLRILEVLHARDAR